jgi:adenylate cyclase
VVNQSSTCSSAHGPADDWVQSRANDGTEPIGSTDSDVGPLTIYRCFAFVDICGSTAFLEQAGTRATVDTITAFRSELRSITSRRGLRVAQWLGDGAMLVGTQAGPVIAAAVEACSTGIAGPLHVRAGVAASAALLFDGDDYVAAGANLAARLCDHASVAETVVSGDLSGDIPAWVEPLAAKSLTVKSLGTVAVLAHNGNFS